MSAGAQDDAFAPVLASVAHVDGWMTDEQARRLWDRAAALDAGQRIVEIGSFRGRSAIVLARGAADGVEIVAIDPHAGNDRGPDEIEGFAAEAEGDFETFHANLRSAGVASRVHHVRRPSQDALSEVRGPVDLLYIDGAHRYTPALADIRRWGARVPAGGTLLIHDSFSAVGVTLAIVRALFFAPDWVFMGRTTSMAEYRRLSRRLGGRARLHNAAAQAAQLPWFVRCQVLKVLIRLGRDDWARRLGHTTGPWPH